LMYVLFCFSVQIFIKENGILLFYAQLIYKDGGMYSSGILCIKK